MAPRPCRDPDVLRRLEALFPHNGSTWHHLLACNDSATTPVEPTTSLFEAMSYTGIGRTPELRREFYAYVTPFIVIVGLFGNLISLRVFLSSNLRRLSASLYLSSLSASDTLVLLTYVSLDWLYIGLPRWPGGYRLPVIHHEGICHGFLYASYTLRFISVWLIVVFTVERYIAVCRPLQRRIICTKTFARRIISAVVVCGALVSLFKPILSGVYNIPSSSGGIGNYTGMPDNDHRFCMRNPQYSGAIFVMELTYGLLITAVPWLVITVFNFLILRKLINRDTTGHLKLIFRESKVRLEFTVTLLAISSCFICLNIPYFIVWCQQFILNVDPHRSPQLVLKISNQLNVTKTIFNINYCVNFALYCLTGSYYRSEMLDFCLCRQTSHRMYQSSSRKCSITTSFATYRD